MFSSLQQQSSSAMTLHFGQTGDSLGERRLLSSMTVLVRVVRLPPPHVTHRFGDPPFSRPSLLRDTAQYIGHRILG